jgi:hypothetical protein
MMPGEGVGIWSLRATLREMLNRAEEIKDKHATAMEPAAGHRANLPLIDVIDDILAEDDGDDALMVCHI